MGRSNNASVYSLYRNEQNKLQLCQVSVSLAKGLNDCKIIGGADKTIKEASLRVKSALKASNFRFPNGKIVVNLSPVLATKKGSSLDFAIALAILAVSKQIKLPPFCLAYGELTLDGQIIEPDSLLWQFDLAETKQQLSSLLNYLQKLYPLQSVIALGPSLASTLTNPQHILSLFANQLAVQNTFMLKKVDDVKQLDFANTIRDIGTEFEQLPIALDTSMSSDSNLLTKEMLLTNLEATAEQSLQTYLSLRNLDLCKSAFKLALAGGHSLALIGSNGSGKTELLHSAVYFLQDEIKSQIEQSCMRLPKLDDYIFDIDFMTLPSMLLNYRLQKGCLWQLANGLIFLSELNKFKKEAILCLEQFYQQQITLERARKQVQMGAANDSNNSLSPHCQVLVDFNPCPCGNFFEPWLSACNCSNYRIKLFNQRLTGAIWDRLALIAISRRLETQEIDLQTITENATTDNLSIAANIRGQIMNCRTRQRERNAKICQHFCLNSQLSLAELDKVQPITQDIKNFLRILRISHHCSYRRIMMIRTVALTLADLAAEKCQIEHFLQASNYCALPEDLIDV